jgi:hypothetical protein
MDISYLAVVVAAVVSYAVGAVWHSPIGFGVYWMKLMGLTKESLRDMPLTPSQAMSIGAVVTLVQAFVLGYFVSLLGVVTIDTALQLGFWVWLGFLVPTLANSWLWEGRSLKLFAFNAAYALVSIEIMAIILGLWH